MRIPKALSRVPVRVSLREFKARLSYYLARAGTHGVIEVTSNRKVVARVTGVPPKEGQGLARLIAAGSVTWRGGKPAGAAILLTKRGLEVSEMVLEDRG